MRPDSLSLHISNGIEIGPKTALTKMQFLILSSKSVGHASHFRIYSLLSIRYIDFILNFRNSKKFGILAGELAIEDEASGELVQPPIFALVHTAVQLADREGFGAPAVLWRVFSQTDDVCIVLAERALDGQA